MSGQKDLQKLQGGDPDRQAAEAVAGRGALDPTALSVPVLPPVAHRSAHQAAWEAIHKARAWGAYPSEHLIRFVAKHYRDRRQALFLDVGAGYGASTWFLAREGHRVRAVDVAPSALHRLRGRLHDEALSWRVSFQVGDIARMQLPPGAFDGAIDMCCLQHLTEEDAAEALVNIRRSLRPGAWMLSMLATAPYGDREGLRLTHAPDDMFTGWAKVRVGSEMQSRPSGTQVSHWIVEAQK